MEFGNLSRKGSADSTTSMLSHHTRGSMKTCHKVLLIIYLVVVSLVAIAALILAGFVMHWQQADVHTHVPGVFTSADSESTWISPENAQIWIAQLSNKLDDLDSKVQEAKQELSSLKKRYVSNHNALNTSLQVVKQDFEDKIANVSQALASEFQLVVGNFTEKFESLEESMMHSREAVNTSLGDLSRDVERRLSQASNAEKMTHKNMADARETAMEGFEEKMNGQLRELYNEIARVENQQHGARSSASSVSKAHQTSVCMLIPVLLFIFMT